MNLNFYQHSYNGTQEWRIYFDLNQGNHVCHNRNHSWCSLASSGYQSNYANAYVQM